MNGLMLNTYSELLLKMEELTKIPMKHGDVQYRLSEILVVYTPMDNGFGYYHPKWTIFWQQVIR